VLYGVFDAGHTIAYAAAMHPERVLGLVFNRVPLHFDAAAGASPTLPGGDSPALWLDRMPRAQGRASQTSNEGISSADLDLWFHPNGAPQTAGLAAMMETIGIGSHDAGMLVAGWERTSSAEAASAQEALLRGSDLRPLLARLDLPAMVLAPARRPTPAAWGKALCALLPRGRLVTAENGGETLGAMHSFLAVLSSSAGKRASRISTEMSGTMNASTRSVGSLRRIVVPVDPNVTSGRAVELACRLGEAQQAEILLVHVLAVPRTLALDHPLPEARRRGERALALGEAIAAEHGMHSTACLLTGRVVADSILRLARDEAADLIVMAQSNAAGVQEEISRTVQEVVRRSPCEVIIDDPGAVRHPGSGHGGDSPALWLDRMPKAQGRASQTSEGAV